MIISEENRHGPRLELRSNVVEPERAQLCSVVDVNKLLNSVNIAHALFLIERQCSTTNHAFFQVVFTKLQQLNVFMILSSTHERCMSIGRRIGQPAVYQGDAKRAVKSNIICLFK